jgi:formylglycine-generating enzyme required for sulfatase activity
LEKRKRGLLIFAASCEIPLVSRTRIVALVAFAALSALVVATVVWFARRARHDPARCAEGFVPSGARCCPRGQVLARRACAGTLSSCPRGLARAVVGSGCVAENQRVRLAAGSLEIAPSDWEAQGQTAARTISVESFEIDSSEVTEQRWGACVLRGICNAIQTHEPGLPVTNVSASEAERFCRFARGRLPTGDEWLYAAAGTAGRRYPWGQTGLVCRRAVFGLLDGPCAHGATGPELAGARPDGATPDGILDLSGNVAEWTRDERGFSARGGSFRSGIAGELKSVSALSLSGEERAPDVGFRCAYPIASK